MPAVMHPDIINKRRTIDDLIRYIRTCTEGNPNYLLLLGAGCSITSGIRGAMELIGAWEHAKAYEIIKTLRNEEPYNKTFIILEAYILLKLGKLQDAHDFMREFLMLSNFSEPVLLVNCQLGNKLMGKKINDERLEKAKIHPESTNLIKAAASVLQDNRKDALEYLQKEEDKNCESKFFYRDWIVFDTIRTDAKFKQFFSV